jgi:hypothetical protein
MPSPSPGVDPQGLETRSPGYPRLWGNIQSQPWRANHRFWWGGFRVSRTGVLPYLCRRIPREGFGGGRTTRVWTPYGASADFTGS